MAVSLLFFEDAVADHLQPLTLTRPTHDLRVGLLTIREKWMLALGAGDASPTPVANVPAPDADFEAARAQLLDRIDQPNMVDSLSRVDW